MSTPIVPDGWPAHIGLLHVTETPSTNALALKLAAEGQSGPMWVLADHQSAGRGRSGRSWVSVAGNLSASLLLSSPAPIARAPQLSLLTGVAVIDALHRAEVPGARLKWPNDILIGRGKAGGILVESTTRMGEPGFVAALGIGLNLAAAPDIANRKVTSLSAHGVSASPARILSLIATEMDVWLKKWNEAEGFELVRQAWLERSGPIGEPLSVNTGSGLTAGCFAGLDLDGALLLDVGGAGRPTRFTFGDVTLES